MKNKHKNAYMKCAYVWAECSHGQRAKVGAIIVKDNNPIAFGYNGLPESLEGPLEGDDGSTLPEVRHAEKNALMRLIRLHESAIGASLFVTMQPCFYCALDIVDAGIREVYYSETYRCSRGIDHLIRNGIHVEHLPIQKENLIGYFST